MNRERFEELVIDYLGGALGPAERAAFADHLAGCAACRGEAESLGRIWDRLGRLPDESPPPAMRARVLAALGARPAHDRGRIVRLAALAALAASLVLAGALAGAALRGAVPPGAGSPRAGDEYIVLLYESPSDARAAADERGSVEEHKSWARGLAAAGALVGGEKLAPERRVLAPDGAARADAALAGYFLITARSFDDAVAVARSCPHYVHGGAVEVRRIEPV